MRLLTKIFSITLIFLLVAVSAFAQKKKKGELSEQEKAKAEGLFIDATKERLLGNPANAAELYKECLKIDANNSAAMYELATIYFNARKDEQAVELINQAVKIDPKNEWYRLLLSDIYSQTGKNSEAAKILESLSNDFPKKPEFLYEWATELLKAGKYEEAIKVYNRIEENLGISEEISIQKHSIYLSMKQGEKAAEEIKKLIAAFPENSRYLGMLADLYTSLGKKDEAFALYEKMEKTNPSDPLLHLSLANYYREKGDKEKSYTELKKAFQNPDLDIDTKINILLSYYVLTEVNKELTSQALELTEILVDVHPKEGKAHAMHADYLFREGKLKEAQEAFRKTIALDNSKFLVWSSLLQVNYTLNDYESLLKESNEALELFPTQAIVYLFNGIANMQLKNYDDAIAILNSGVAYAKKDKQLSSQFYSSLGDAYNFVKNHKESDAAYEKALEIDPENITVLNNYAYYLSLRKENMERAEAMSKKSNELEPDNASFEDTYGWIMYQQGKFTEAKEWIGKALKSAEKPSGVEYEHYGDVLWQLGEKDAAKEYWNKAKVSGGGSDLLDRKLSEGRLVE
ncbi:MAG: Beta-barrel assembly-enhancing protease [Bacteroidia bacterium]|nr:Beta-barrel assembly-enhancing protease [Bacteroidia bacterium]